MTDDPFDWPDAQPVPKQKPLPVSKSLPIDVPASIKRRQLWYHGLAERVAAERRRIEEALNLP
jgi:hypothetical protein